MFYFFSSCMQCSFYSFYIQCFSYSYCDSSFLFLILLFVITFSPLCISLIAYYIFESYIYFLSIKYLNLLLLFKRVNIIFWTCFIFQILSTYLYTSEIHYKQLLILLNIYITVNILYTLNTIFHSVQWYAMISQPANGWHKSRTKKHLEFKNNAVGHMAFSAWLTCWPLIKVYTLTIIVQYMQNIYIIFNISILTYVYIFIISLINIGNLCIFIEFWWVSWSIIQAMQNIAHFFILIPILILILNLINV